jgi:hypothetical protein
MSARRGAPADRPDLDVSEIDVPGFEVVVVGAAAGEGGHHGGLKVHIGFTTTNVKFEAQRRSLLSPMSRPVRRTILRM